MGDTEELRALLSRATPGPWRFEEHGIDAGVVGPSGSVSCLYGERCEGAVYDDDPDAQAIVAVMNAIGPLLAEVEAARACIEEIRRISGPTRIVVRDAIAAYDAATKGEP